MACMRLFILCITTNSQKKKKVFYHTRFRYGSRCPYLLLPPNHSNPSSMHFIIISNLSKYKNDILFALLSLSH